MPSAMWPLRSAVYSALSANAPLMAMVSGVYAKVPETVPEPYITIGPVLQVTADDHGESGADCEVYVHVWSRQEGYAEASEIFAALDSVLHRRPLIVPGWDKVSVALRSVSEEADPDPDIRHMLAIYRVWLTKEGA